MSTIGERVRRVATAAVMIIATACSTDTTAPMLHGTPEANLARGTTATTSTTNTSAASLTTVKAVGRLGTLGRDVRATATIGSEGGSLSLPSLGFTLVVPRGAVAGATRFSVTAVAGRTVAYEFEPHGMTFAKPLTFRQDIRYTSFGWGQSPLGGYFPDRSLVNDRTGHAQVSEQMQAQVKGAFIEFLINHFSGYLVSCA